MNKFAFNIDTKYLQKKILYLNNSNNYNYKFLNHIKIDNIDVYYDILKNIEEFKLKNFYNYLFKKINKLNISEKLIKINIDKNINDKELNYILYEYIKNNDVKGIIIMNSIQQYYYPIK